MGRRKKIGNILVYFIFLLRPWTDTLGKWYITFLDLLLFGLESGLPQIKSLVPSGTLPRSGSKLSLLKNEMRNICLTDNQKKSYHTQWRAYYYTKENIKNVFNLCDADSTLQTCFLVLRTQPQIRTVFSIHFIVSC